MSAYKAFDKDFKCRDFQYVVGETYTHDGAVVPCKSGFHSCENPFDVLGYYALVGSRFAEVTVDGDKKTEGNKLCSGKITIAVELSLGDFTRRCVDWLIKKVTADAGNAAQLASSGNAAQLASSGNAARLASSGNAARLASSGYAAQLASSGNAARLASSGNAAQLASSGYAAQLASSGNAARLASSGDDGVIASSGFNARASGAIGTWISIAEFGPDYKCVGFATGCIGKDGLLPDVEYIARGGKLVSA